jgi:hypothetical protein
MASEPRSYGLLLCSEKTSGTWPDISIHMVHPLPVGLSHTILLPICRFSGGRCGRYINSSATMKFDPLPNFKGHVFALLAYRVCLTPCIRNAVANELSTTAVSSHLRLISSINLQHGRTLTTTPSEPLVSEATAHYLAAIGQQLFGYLPNTYWLLAYLIQGLAVEFKAPNVLSFCASSQSFDVDDRD